MACGVCWYACKKFSRVLWDGLGRLECGMSSRAWQFGLACGLAGAGDVWPCGPTPLEAELSWLFGRPRQMDVGAGELACGNRSDLWQRDMDEGRSAICDS